MLEYHRSGPGPEIDERRTANELAQGVSLRPCKSPGKVGCALFIRSYKLTRLKLDRVGVAFGYIPSLKGENTTLNLAEPLGVTQKDLLATIDDRNTFDKLYVMITNRAIECYTVGGGKRAALRLHASLASLDRCVFINNCFIPSHLFHHIVIEDALLKRYQRFDHSLRTTPVLSGHS